MKIYVVRHGLTKLNQQKKVNGEIDEPLIPKGVKQVKEAIASLPIGIKYIYTSPMIRAKQTAKIISDALRVPIIPIQELTEIRMGSLAGKSWDEMGDELDLKKKHRSIQFDYQLFGGENAEDVKKRISLFLKNIYGKHKDNETLVVTHGGIIRTLHLLEHDEILADDIKNISLHAFNLNHILKKRT